MDKKTETEATCGCDRRRQTCIHSLVSRSGNLLARRITAKTGRPVNLAKLGKYRAPQEPEYERKLKWLHIDFTSQGLREQFEREFGQTKDIYDKKLLCYHGEMSQERQNRIGWTKGRFRKYETPGVKSKVKRSNAKAKLASRTAFRWYTRHHVGSECARAPAFCLTGWPSLSEWWSYSWLS